MPDLSRTIESELHLLCPDKPGEVNSLVATLRHGVVHYLLVLALGGFLGGALGGMFGTPLSLEFAATAGKASAHRLIAAVLAAGLGSFFGLWVGYHHIADIGAFLGTFLGAGTGAFLATVFTWDR